MLSEAQGRYIAYAAIALSIIGLLMFGFSSIRIGLGLVAMALSAFGLLKSETEGLNWNALAIGSITVILGIL